MLSSLPYGSGKKTLGEQAYAAIREAILTMQVKPGQLVYESDFTRMLHMSRTPVREAIRALALEDLIEVLPQRGMRVTLISPKRVEETRFVRESLEVSALREIAMSIDVNHRTAVQLKKDLDGSLLQQRDACKAGDAMSFLEADDQFHRALLNYFHNDTLLVMVGQIRSHLNRVRMLSLFDVPAMESLIADHERIVDALFSHDVETATRIMQVHLRRVMEDISVIIQRYPSYFAEESSLPE
ncbi:GntR family transcriptional regulator [Alicyclobacillus acidiphilus]|uniref:GntR family transcriptional regulator n=1 Tax=Alicyclobacillus acidiphilus TaxID=182455 RepID=UPI00083459E9|nr:GntR family transcriptional regulator [Alicyclobacillus acidiphilus]